MRTGEINMKTQIRRTVKFISVIFGSLLVVTVLSFAQAPHKKSSPNKLPSVNSQEISTDEGITFKIPSDWKQSKVFKIRWDGRDGLWVAVLASSYSSDEVKAIGFGSVEEDGHIIYNAYKSYKNKYKDVRILKINGVKGVHYVSDGINGPQEKYVSWSFEHDYQGQRQKGIIRFTSPTNTFSKNKILIYQILNSFKFPADKRK